MVEGGTGRSGEAAAVALNELAPGCASYRDVHAGKKRIESILDFQLRIS